MTMSRLSSDIIDLTQGFIQRTAKAWMEGRLIRCNSYGVEILVAQRPGSDFADAAARTFYWTLDGAEHGAPWYIDNAHGKNLICLATKMDSHEAVRSWQGLVRQIEGAFPWGGAVIDPNYGLIIGTSGFKEDEDILFSRTVRNFVVMHLDREGTGVLTDARDRGEQEGEAGADRFTRTLHVI
jgi:hypothetical protein